MGFIGAGGRGALLVDAAAGAFYETRVGKASFFTGGRYAYSTAVGDEDYQAAHWVAGSLGGTFETGTVLATLELVMGTRDAADGKKWGVADLWFVLPTLTISAPYKGVASSPN